MDSATFEVSAARGSRTRLTACAQTSAPTLETQRRSTKTSAANVLLLPVPIAFLLWMRRCKRRTLLFGVASLMILYRRMRIWCRRLAGDQHGDFLRRSGDCILTWCCLPFSAASIIRAVRGHSLNRNIESGSVLTMLCMRFSFRFVTLIANANYDVNRLVR
jgi:hypothetical protein